MENAPFIFLSHLKCLRVLSFKDFPLDILPDSVGELIHLRYLDLSWTNIEKLPESLSNLYNLQTLKLRCCFWLKMLPVGMQDLVNLRHLNIWRTGLEEVPKGMSRLKNLQILSDFKVGKHEENGIEELGALVNLRGSLRISELQNVINSEQALKAKMGDKKHIYELDLSWSSGDDIADSQMERDILNELRPHVDLKVLRIECYRGTLFPNWLGDSSYHNMTYVILSGCSNCCMLPSLGQLPSLKHLYISGFEGLEMVGAEFYGDRNSKSPFPSLDTLSFESMPLWKEWISLEPDAFPRLKELKLRGCPMLTGGLPNQLPSLERLEVKGCEQLSSFLPRANAIQELSITGKNRVRIGELHLSTMKSLRIEGSHLVEPVLEATTHGLLTCLEKFIIRGCSSAISFQVGSLPASLQSLWIRGCSSAISFQVGSLPASLQSLDIRDCSSAITFPAGCLSASLRSLSITNCSQLELQSQLQLESLKSLSFDDCHSLTSLSLDAFPNLTNLSIYRCENMKSLELSQSLSSLCDLTIYDCPNMVSLSPQGMFAPQLESLSILRCPQLDPFPKGDLPPNLAKLSIYHSEKLVSFLRSLNSHSHCLTQLTIHDDNDRVTSFPEEALLPASLESLYLWQFPSLETLDCKGLVHLTSLQKLAIHNCPKLESVAGERLPASLIRLGILGSPLLEKRCEMKDPQVWPKISHIPGIQINYRKWIF